MTPKPILGVIGGSGLYQFPALENTEIHDLDTPFGKPSAPLISGTLDGRTVVFLARHGIGHTISPSEVNYRANIYALKIMGVEQIVSISACGSLRDDFAPGEIVIPDQLVDFTRGRTNSFFGEGLVAHISSANPFCQRLSDILANAVQQSGGILHPGGTLIAIEGPRFSTRAESNLYREWGLSIIGMTACPEAFLAREAEMCYATMAHVTDYDVWRQTEAPVSVEMVIGTLMKNTELAQKAVQLMVSQVPDEVDCSCSHALADAIITAPDHILPETRKKLDLFVGKYLSK
jgi:5'-methylthioadenosine phosphorylase